LTYLVLALRKGDRLLNVSPANICILEDSSDTSF
jgi:hypothetical protein